MCRMRWRGSCFAVKSEKLKVKSWKNEVRESDMGVLQVFVLAEVELMILSIV